MDQMVHESMVLGPAHQATRWGPESVPATCGACREVRGSSKNRAIGRGSTATRCSEVEGARGAQCIPGLSAEATARVRAMQEGRAASRCVVTRSQDPQGKGTSTRKVATQSSSSSTKSSHSATFGAQQNLLRATSSCSVGVEPSSGAWRPSLRHGPKGVKNTKQSPGGPGPVQDSSERCPK